MARRWVLPGAAAAATALVFVAAALVGADRQSRSLVARVAARAALFERLECYYDAAREYQELDRIHPHRGHDTLAARLRGFLDAEVELDRAALLLDVSDTVSAYRIYDSLAKALPELPAAVRYLRMRTKGTRFMRQVARGRLLCARGEFDAAAALMVSLAVVDNDDARREGTTYLFKKARLLERGGKLRSAAQVYYQVVKRDPGNSEATEALLRLGLAGLEGGDR